MCIYFFLNVRLFLENYIPIYHELLDRIIFCPNTLIPYSFASGYELWMNCGYIDIFYLVFFLIYFVCWTHTSYLCTKCVCCRLFSHSRLVIRSKLLNLCAALICFWLLLSVDCYICFYGVIISLLVFPVFPFMSIKSTYLLWSLSNLLLLHSHLWSTLLVNMQ